MLEVWGVGGRQHVLVCGVEERPTPPRTPVFKIADVIRFDNPCQCRCSLLMEALSSKFALLHENSPDTASSFFNYLSSVKSLVPRAIWQLV